MVDKREVEFIREKVHLSKIHCQGQDFTQARIELDQALKNFGKLKAELINKFGDNAVNRASKNLDLASIYVSRNEKDDAIFYLSEAEKALNAIIVRF